MSGGLQVRHLHRGRRIVSVQEAGQQVGDNDPAWRRAAVTPIMTTTPWGGGGGVVHAPTVAGTQGGVVQRSSDEFCLNKVFWTF